jgi:hypothetical protein
MAVILPLIFCSCQNCFILLGGIVPAQVLVHSPHLHAPAAPERQTAWHCRASRRGNQAHIEA